MVPNDEPFAIAGDEDCTAVKLRQIAPQDKEVPTHGQQLNTDRAARKWISPKDLSPAVRSAPGCDPRFLFAVSYTAEQQAGAPKAIAWVELFGNGRLEVFLHASPEGVELLGSDRLAGHRPVKEPQLPQ